MSDPDVVDYFVFDGDPSADVPIAPHRPTLGNLGGGEFENDTSNPPDPKLCPTAEGENQMEKVTAGLGQMTFSLGVSIGFTDGAPVLRGFSTLGTRLQTGNITLTDNGVGDTTISWPPGYLPERTLGPNLSLNEDIEIDRQRIILADDGLSVRVKTKLGTVGTDCGFTFWVH